MNGMDNLRTFILNGLMNDMARARRLQMIKAPHANPASIAKPHFDREAIKAMRAPKVIERGKKPIIEGPSLINSSPHGRLFKGHRP